MSVECKCLALVEAVVARGRGVQEGIAPFLHGGASTPHVDFAIANGPGCDSWVFLLACASSWEMESGCGGASRMVSCRDDGGRGVGVGAKPCLNWVPSSSFDSARP